MPNDIQPINPGDSQIVLYQPNETLSLEVKIDDALNTVWLSIDQMAELFGRDKSVIGKHVRACFKEGELQKESVWAKFAYTASDGKTYQVDFYSLDVIISVGYRVKSPQGTQFRIWATNVLRDYLLKGYNVNRHLIALQERMDERMTHIEDVQSKQQQQLDFFIRTSTPPAEMVFFEGDFYTARAALENLVRTATTSFDRHGTSPEQSRRRTGSKYDNYGIHIYTPTVQQSILRWNYSQFAA